MSKKKRIVQVTFASGKTVYRVERPAIHIFGLPLLWTIDVVRDPLYDRPTGAVFSTLEEACAHCGLQGETPLFRHTLKIVK